MEEIQNLDKVLGVFGLDGGAAPDRQIDVSMGVYIRDNHKKPDIHGDNYYRVSIDEGVEGALREIMVDTLKKAAFDKGNSQKPIEQYDCAEEYSSERLLYLEKDSEFLKAFHILFELGESKERLHDATNLSEYFQDVGHYFVLFTLNDLWCMGIREAKTMKGTLSSKNRLCSILDGDDTELRLLEKPVIRLDKQFDCLIDRNGMYIFNAKAAERMLGIKSIIHNRYKSNLSTIRSSINEKTGLEVDLSLIDDTNLKGFSAFERKALSVASKIPDYDLMKKALLLSEAKKHGIEFSVSDEKVVTFVDLDATKDFIVFLDDRFYASTFQTGVSYVVLERKITR